MIQSPAMKRFLLVGGILLAILAVLCLVSCLLLGTSPAADDRDLAVSRAPLAESSNAFSGLQTAASLIVASNSLQLSHLASESNWNAAAVAEILAKNEKEFAAFDAALASPDLRVPEFRPQEDLKYLSEWKQLCTLAAIRANALFRDGMEREAFAEALKLVRWGNQIQRAQGSILHYLIGVAIKTQGLTLMQRWVSRTHLPAAELVALAAQLIPEVENEQGYADSLKVEYQQDLTLLRDLRDGKTQNPGNPPLITIKVLPVFSYGKTQRLYADAFRALIKSGSVPYSEAKLPDNTNRPSTAKLILSGNAAGQIFYYTLMPSVRTVLSKQKGQAAATQSTRLVLALRAFQMQKGDLPEDLASLVPDYLDRVPLDSFDGHPMRYSPSQKLVYSIGENLRDDNGQTKDAQGNRLDYPVSFGW
jgi:hypothetical protein